MGVEIERGLVTKVIVSSPNYKNFEKATKELMEILRGSGRYYKSLPLKLERGEAGRRAYVKEFIVPTGEADAVAKIISGLKSKEGYLFHGKVFHLPEYVDVKIVLEQEEIPIIKKNKPGRAQKQRMPTNTIEQELAMNMGAVPATLIARSTELDTLKKFIDMFVKVMEQVGCPATRRGVFACKEGSVIIEAGERFSLSTKINCQPGMYAKVKVLVPSNEKGANNKDVFTVEYIPLIDDYPILKEVFESIPQLKEYVENGGNINDLVVRKPSLGKQITEKFGVDLFTILADYQMKYIASKRVCTLSIRVAAKNPEEMRGAKANVFIDGKRVIPMTSARGANIKPTKELPIIDTITVPVSVNPTHTLTVNVQKYSYLKNKDNIMYKGYVWFFALPKCYRYANSIASKNPNRIALVHGNAKVNKDLCKPINQ